MCPCADFRGFRSLVYSMSCGWTKRERSAEEKHLCVHLYEARVKFIFMAERMGCKDGRIVVICENFGKWYVHVVVFRVIFCVCVWGSTRNAPTCSGRIAYPSRSTTSRTLAHFPTSTSSELFHKTTFWHSSLLRRCETSCTVLFSHFVCACPNTHKMRWK